VWFPLAKQRHAINPQDRNVPQGAPMQCLGTKHAKSSESAHANNPKPDSDNALNLSGVTSTSTTAREVVEKYAVSVRSIKAATPPARCNDETTMLDTALA
jgi:hypothetical protein